MDYGDSVQGVLLRKIRKAEQDVLQLRLDYCRFVFGLSHRSRVLSGDQVYEVTGVAVDSMVYTDDGSLSRPGITGVPVDAGAGTEPVDLGTDWSLDAKAIK